MKYFFIFYRNLFPVINRDKILNHFSILTFKNNLHFDYIEMIIVRLSQGKLSQKVGLRLGWGQALSLAQIGVAGKIGRIIECLQAHPSKSWFELYPREP